MSQPKNVPAFEWNDGMREAAKRGKGRAKRARKRAAQPREATPGVTSNVLDESNMTLAEAVSRYRATGKPAPSHLVRDMTFVSGTEKPRVTTLPRDLMLGTPWYRVRPQAHTGNANPCHGTALGIPAGSSQAIRKGRISS